jgi:hypothetical protein
MPAKRKPARRKATSRARATTPRRRTTTTRKKSTSRVRVPRKGPLHAQLGARVAIFAVKRLETREETIRSRKDAAILRATHEGCAKCGGNGQIFTKGKDGSFTGSKPCPATPTKAKVSKWAVYKASRFGADKRSGLVGCSCPCGWKQKPKFRDAKEATKALRAHEKQKHGSKTVGGTWYAQTTGDQPAQPAAEVEPVISKVVTDSGMTDEQWIKQNKKLHPGKAIAQGKCWKCAGNGKLHGAFAGEQMVIVCTECKGNGKAAKAAA